MSHELAGRRGRVLIADDSRTARMVIGRALADGGYHVQAASDGFGLRAALQRPDSPSLVVTDWIMPGPTGVELCRELRSTSEGERFYVIVVTARTEPEHLLEALAAGADDFITKPFSPAELLARVNAGMRVVELQDKLQGKIRELGEALAEVRTLRGLIPICTHCHRIRTSPDHWQKLESYIEEHSEAVLSHGLCRDCLERHYPEHPAGDEEAA